MFYDELKTIQVLCDEGRATEATNQLIGIARQAKSPVEHYGLGCCLSRLGLFELAEAAFETALPHLQLGSQIAYTALSELAEVKLCLGKASEARRVRMSMQGRDWWNCRLSSIYVNDPALELFRSGYGKWLRNQPVEGKSLIVFNDGGLGDFLQSSRYIEHLKDEGAAIIRCQPPEPMWELIAKSRLPVKLTTLTLETVVQCDYWIWSLDLCERYQRTPSQPQQIAGYLQPVRQMVPEISLPSSEKGKSSERWNVGIVWRSDNRSCRHEPFRSMHLDTLVPLFDISSVQFYSLQFGSLTEMERVILGRHQVIDMSPFIHSLADTARILSQLDLLISVDSMPVHLAGSCNRPVWTMLSRAADGRWGDRSQSTTPWYSSMRLFRQVNLGDWNPVIHEIGNALRASTLWK